MFRVIKVGHKYVARKIDLTQKEAIESIKYFTDNGDPVILVDDIDDLDRIVDINFINIEILRDDLEDTESDTKRGI